MILKGIGGGVLCRNPTYNNDVPGDRRYIVILNVSSIVFCLQIKITNQNENFYFNIKYCFQTKYFIETSLALRH